MTFEMFNTFMHGPGGAIHDIAMDAQRKRRDDFIEIAKGRVTA